MNLTQITKIFFKILDLEYKPEKVEVKNNQVKKKTVIAEKTAILSEFN